MVMIIIVALMIITFAMTIIKTPQMIDSKPPTMLCAPATAVKAMKTLLFRSNAIISITEPLIIVMETHDFASESIISATNTSFSDGFRHREENPAAVGRRLRLRIRQ